MKCLIDEIVLTNKIEGVNSTRKEITEVLEKLSEKKSDRRFHGLVMKYSMLMDCASLKLDTCQDVRDIYNDLVLREVVEENPHDAPDGVIFRKECCAKRDPSGHCSRECNPVRSADGARFHQGRFH